MTKENNPNYRHGLTFNKTCKCGEAISYYNNRCWSCWRKELSTLHSGEGNPAWKGGTSFEPYALGWNETFKEQIRYRDRYQCQVCGVTEVELIRKLTVHHKDYNKKNLELTNLISLCNRCHGKTNHNRAYWVQYFSKTERTILPPIGGNQATEVPK